MEGLTSLLGKLSVEDIEKLKALISFGKESISNNKGVTIGVFAEEYESYIKQSRSDSYYNSVILSFNHLDKFFSQRDCSPSNQKMISSITLKEIENFVAYLQQKIKPGLLLKGRTGEGYRVYFRTLKAAFNKAVEWGYVKENCFLRVKLPKKQKLNPAFIDKVQLSRITNQIENQTVRDIVITGFYTGMRLNELLNLTWRNVNTNNKIITVGDEEFITKGRNQRYIPISAEVMEVLERNKREKPNNKSLTVVNITDRGIGNKYVFYKSNGIRFTGNHVSKCFKTACRTAGIDKSIHFHSLRHSFASHLIQQGVSIYTIKELLGHSSISTTEIYSHLNIDTLKEAMSVLDEPREDRNEEIEMKAKKGNMKQYPELRLIINKK